MMMRFYLAAILFAVANCAEIKFRSCIRDSDKHRAIEVHKVIMEPCEQFPCPLVKGKTTTLKIEITPNVTEDYLVDAAEGKVARLLWHRFKLPYKDNCVKTGICPLQAGQKYDYVYSLPISNFFPRVRVLIKWRLQRKDGSDALCIMLPARITKYYHF